jgi:hypothetical protein
VVAAQTLGVVARCAEPQKVDGHLAWRRGCAVQCRSTVEVSGRRLWLLVRRWLGSRLLSGFPAEDEHGTKADSDKVDDRVGKGGNLARGRAHR